jgi:hypothetical protein
MKTILHVLSGVLVFIVLMFLSSTDANAQYGTFHCTPHGECVNNCTNGGVANFIPDPSGYACCLGPNTPTACQAPPSTDLCPDGKSINTAIGCIPVESPAGFITTILRWATGIAGGIAFILIVYAGFEIITAGGNPQKVQAGRELLTAAIMGLMFLLFSAFILRFFGVDLLGIPGL